MGTNYQLGTGQDEDAWSPVEMTGKQLENRVVLTVSSGGQHTVLLVKDKEQSWWSLWGPGSWPPQPPSWNREAVMTTCSSRPLPALSTLSPPAFSSSAEQNPSPFCVPFFSGIILGLTGWGWDRWKRGEGFLSEGTLLIPQPYGQTFPLIPTSHGTGWPWFCLSKTKTSSPACLVPIYAEKSGSIKPRSSPVPLFPSFTTHRRTHGTVVRPSCHGLMPGGNWRRGRATQPWATPGQIFGPEQVPMGQEEKQGSSAWSRKKLIRLSPRSTKHSVLQALSVVSPIHPASPAAKGLKSGKAAVPAGQDLRGEGKEGFINKQQYWEWKEGGEEGWRSRVWSPERETAACTVAEKTGKGFDFLFFLM